MLNADNNLIISVIIPVYNGEKTIEDALNSVFNQSYTNFEVLVVNDGSTDGTEEKVRNFIGKLNEIESSKIHYYRKENSGPSGSRNFAVERSRGSFIAFLDADDEWVEEKLETQIDLFQKYPEVSLIGGDLYDVGRTSNIKVRKIRFRRLLFKNYFLTSTIMLKSFVLEKYKFDEQQKYSEDYKLWLQICYDFDCLYISKLLAKNQVKKRAFGDQGLSAHIHKMEACELDNYSFLLKNRKINLLTYLAATAFSLLKYLRRVLLVTFNKK